MEEISNVLVKHNVTECLLACPEECNKQSFNVFTHFSQYPNDLYASFMTSYYSKLATLNLSNQDLKESVLMLNVNYETMTTTIIEEISELSFPTLLGNLGGQLGLLLGMSFLSFIELFEMMVIIVWEKSFGRFGWFKKVVVKKYSNEVNCKI